MSKNQNWKTTREAWLEMIVQKGIHEVLGYTAQRVWILRTKARRKNEYPKQELMEKHLMKAGYEVKSEKLWERK